MYQFAYEEVANDTAINARHREKIAIRHSIDLLEEARQEGVGGVACARALQQVSRLCSFLAEDLASPDNALPDQLRADLISIYLWVLQECELIRQKKTTDLMPLIEILTIISDGLDRS